MKIDEIADLDSVEQRAHLVGCYLFRRIDPHFTEHDLLCNLWDTVDDEIDKCHLGASTHHIAFEVTALADDVRGCADCRGRFDERVNAGCDLHFWRGEEIEILGRAMSQVKARKRGAARQKEALSASEEPIEELSLQHREWIAR